jgi:hypothetical protein
MFKNLVSHFLFPVSRPRPSLLRALQETRVPHDGAVM